ncbi:MAG: S26 family signal peptidase [Bacteroidetes bacterium]|nr:MAG: S26 family signal peptidase [Bacteroidota bacterium]
MGWIIFFVATLGWHLGIYGMFKKAGIEPWKALVPFYNTRCIVKKCQIPQFWFWLQLIPIAGQFITIWLTIIFTMHFGRHNLAHHAAATLVPFAYFPYVGFSKNERFVGEAAVKNYKKSAAREWIDAGVFAIVAATIIRTFVFEAYTIPTGSMEKTLLVNDFLFVNKVAYGPRLPQTPLSFPFVHNLLPFGQTPSYLKWIQTPYTRLPGYVSVKRNDVVVFNFPVGDTIINKPNYGSLHYYAEQVRMFGRAQVWAEHGDEIIVHPADKGDNYIKRCVAVGGETIQVKNGILYVNGNVNTIAPGAQHSYDVLMKNSTPLDFEQLKENHDIEVRVDNDKENYYARMQSVFQEYGYYPLDLTETDAAKLEKLPMVASVKRTVSNYDSAFSAIKLFPYDASLRWTTDNYGPVYIPQKGATITLSAANIAQYRRLITNYEGHTLEESNGQFIVDGKPTTQYTFAYNYYWMMGDNRDQSQDSRFWGFVPETHVVGKASLIWFSWENGPRWKRLFNSIK